MRSSEGMIPPVTTDGGPERDGGGLGPGGDPVPLPPSRDGDHARLGAPEDHLRARSDDHALDESTTEAEGESKRLFSFARFEVARAFAEGVEWVNDSSLSFDAPCRRDAGAWVVPILDEDSEDSSTRDCRPDCPDCGAEAGGRHRGDCDVERCTSCGRQRVGCGCPVHDPDAAAWTGVFPLPGVTLEGRPIGDADGPGLTEVPMSHHGVGEEY